jgi:hypothetical protein
LQEHPGFRRKNRSGPFGRCTDLKILTLPKEVTAFLEENQTPAVLRRFHVKRLVELGRLPREQCLDAFSCLFENESVATYAQAAGIQGVSRQRAYQMVSLVRKEDTLKS